MRSLPLRSMSVMALATILATNCVAQSWEQAQTPEGKVRDTLTQLQAEKTGLLEDSDTLGKLAQTLPQQNTFEIDNAMQINHAILLAVAETDAAIWFTALYIGIGCEKDKEKARVALDNRLKFYSHTLDLNSDTVSHQLAFTRLPAVSQLAIKAEDRMRNAKREMQAILDLTQ